MSALPLAILESRARWPCGIVRERALSAWARLLTDKRHGGAHIGALLKWLVRQNLETSCVDALLVLQRADRMDPEFRLPESAVLRGAVTRPSLVSETLLSEILQEPFDPPLGIMHSGKAPLDERADAFFEAHRQTFVPTFHSVEAGEIDETLDGAFTRQWAFEWLRIVRTSAIPKDTSVFDFWGRSPYSTRLARESQMGDAFRSAWLRALAWGVADDVVKPSRALALAHWVCPLDPDLWGTRPGTRPTDWPRIGKDVDLDSIDLSWVSREAVADRSLVYASGSVDEDASKELEIISFLAPRAGSDSSERIHETLFERMAGMPYPGLGSSAEWWSPGRATPPIPLAQRAHTRASHRYQFSRLARGLWLPSALDERHLQATCRGRAVVFEMDGRAIGHWNDWVERTDLSTHLGRISHGGVVLRVNKSEVDRLISRSGMVLQTLASLRTLDSDERRKHATRQFKVLVH